MSAKYPKWKYSIDPIDGGFRATLCGNANAERDLGDAWTDDPHVHGVEVVPTYGQPDASGKVAFGPAARAPGMAVGRIGM